MNLCFAVSFLFLQVVSSAPSKNDETNETFISYNSANSVLNDDNLRSKESHEIAPRNPQTRYCRKAAKCVKLKYTTCLGVRLPYNSTSLSLVENVRSQEEVQKKLQKWKGLIHIPRCWSVIQPFLCALYMPKCEDDFIDLPSREMCETIQSSCRILRTDDLWPEEFKCDVSYESGCKNEVRDLKFNTTGECKAPLVRAVDEASFYEGVEGCGVQCNDPFFSEEERQHIKVMIKWGSIISCLLNGFAVLTFVMSNPFGNKYPGQAVFWMNFCFLLVSLAFIYQFLGSNERIICHADGTLRTSEPSRENVSCVTNFVVAYFFLIAGIVWLIIFAYTMLLRFLTYEQMRTQNNRWTAYYHMAAWSIPLILTVTITALQQVDGDSLLGICFVGVVNKDIRLIFLLGPLLVSAISWVFLGWCIMKLTCLKRLSKEVMTKRAKSKVQECICKLSAFLAAIIICTIITFYCQIYEWNNYHSWKKSFRSYIVCQLGVVGDTEVENCRMKNRPNFSLVQVQLFALFLIHISVAWWIFTASTIETWKRFILKRIFRKEIEGNAKLKKHEIIARAFEKQRFLNKNGLNSEGRLSIDLCKKDQDPVGLDFELNSVGSNENTSFAKRIPRLMIRRDGIIPASHSNSGQWKNASDSEISYNIKTRTIHMESRRNSSESVVSIQSQYTETICEGARSKKRRSRKSTRRTKSCGPEITTKKSSNLFMEQNLEKEVFTAVSGKTVHVQQPSGIPIRDRRMAITSIAKRSLKLLHIGLKVENQPPDRLVSDPLMLDSPANDGLLLAGQTSNNLSDDGPVSSDQSESRGNETDSNSEDVHDLMEYLK